MNVISLDTATEILKKYREEGAIVDSTLQDGTTLKAYRNLRVTLDGDQLYTSVTVSPVPGINFQLNTLTLVPAVNAA